MKTRRPRILVHRTASAGKSTACTLTCVYCGHAYPSGTPAHGAKVLTEHIRTCEKHPMRKLEADRAKLRDALIGLVGSADPEELQGMIVATETLPDPGGNRTVAIHAMRVLIETA